MSYQKDRDAFIAHATREGLPIYVAQTLLRAATGINRRAELACSSEAADRDRVPCPATWKKPGRCLCDGDGHNGERKTGRDGAVTRIAVQDYRAEERLKAALPAGWELETSGDPRGYTLHVIPPSYAERNAGRDRYNRDSIGVPPGPSGLRW